MISDQNAAETLMGYLAVTQAYVIFFLFIILCSDCDVALYRHYFKRLHRLSYDPFNSHLRVLHNASTCEWSRKINAASAVRLICLSK
jgi:hypothetical protein